MGDDVGFFQAAVDRAVKEKKNVYFPVGHYRLASGLTIHNPQGTTLEGADGIAANLDDALKTEGRDRKLEEARKQRQICRQQAA